VTPVVVVGAGILGTAQLTGVGTAGELRAAGATHVLDAVPALLPIMVPATADRV
jgi:hypothetical protein